MVGEPRSFRALDQRFQAAEMFAVEWFGGAEVHRHAMLHDAVLFEDPVENRQRTTAVDHVVLGDNLEPVDQRLPLQNVVVVGDAESDADSVLGESVESICRHDRKK